MGYISQLKSKKEEKIMGAFGDFLREYWEEIVALFDKIYEWLKEQLLAMGDAE